eukprot:355668-Chlamydomonas_euryale.AAC.6
MVCEELRLVCVRPVWQVRMAAGQRAVSDYACSRACIHASESASELTAERTYLGMACVKRSHQSKITCKGSTKKKRVAVRGRLPAKPHQTPPHDPPPCHPRFLPPPLIRNQIHACFSGILSAMSGILCSITD